MKRPGTGRAALAASTQLSHSQGREEESRPYSLIAALLSASASPIHGDVSTSDFAEEPEFLNRLPLPPTPKLLRALPDVDSLRPRFLRGLSCM